MKKFKKIYIEITNQCNLNCSFCPKTGRPAKIMYLNEFKKVIEKTKNQGDNFYLHVMGEPTSHPQFREILEFCKDNDVKVNITTNGTLLHKVGECIIDNKVRMVSISLHSFEANVINSSMKSYLDKIMEFCKESIGSGIVVELRLWNFDKDSIYDKNKLNGQIIDYIKNNLELDFDFEKAISDKFEEMNNSNSRKFNIKLKDQIYLGMAQHFDWPDINKKERFERGFCYGLRNQISILSNGDVVPCCLDSDGNMVLGNIFEKSLQDIFECKRATSIYTGFTNNIVVEPLCQTCGYMMMNYKKNKLDRVR